LLAAEHQEAAGQRGGALGGIQDLACSVAQRVGGRQRVMQHLRVAGDHGQQIIEVVGHTAGQPSYGFHLLRLAELGLERPALGDVNAGADDVLDLVFEAEQHGVRPHDQALLTGPRQPVVFMLGRENAGAEALEHAPDLFHLLGRDEQIPDGPPDDLFEAVAGRYLASAVEADDAAFAIEDDDEAAYGVQDRGGPIAFAPERLLSPPSLGHVVQHPQGAALPAGLIAQGGGGSGKPHAIGYDGVADKNFLRKNGFAPQGPAYRELIGCDRSSPIRLEDSVALGPVLHRRGGFADGEHPSRR
jgi:hypothetical protein